MEKLFSKPPVSADSEKTQEFTREQLEALRLKEQRRIENEQIVKELSERKVYGMGHFEPEDGKGLPVKDFTNQR